MREEEEVQEKQEEDVKGGENKETVNRTQEKTEEGGRLRRGELTRGGAGSGRKQRE